MKRALSTTHLASSVKNVIIKTQAVVAVRISHC